jgi:hypothetical protein
VVRIREGWGIEIWKLTMNLFCADSIFQMDIVTTSSMIGTCRHQTRGPQSSIQPFLLSQTPSGHHRT